MVKARTAVEEVSNDGSFVRKISRYTNLVTEDGSSGFPAVPGRYHLYISYACPWASRCYMYLKLKGLEDVIGLTRTKEGEEHFGWAFAASDDEFPGAQADPINGAKTIRELYDIAEPDAVEGKFTVPPSPFIHQSIHPSVRPSAQVLWDKEKRTIVNNESALITRMLNTQFNKHARNAALDLAPPELEAAIDEVNGWVYEAINNGVYRAGFATKQQPYEEAFDELFAALDRCESILSKQRYLAGNVFTDADVRLFVTLIRFDEVYTVHFKCNKKYIREYPNLFNYVKEIYQMPGISETVNMKHIKAHYYGSHPSINPYGIIPKGSNIDFSTPHNRDRFPKA
eukprot:jgi/Mesen1/720/ME001096S10746